MIEYDGQFWNRYYEWAVASPLQRATRRFTAAIEDFQAVLRDEFNPVVRKAMWAIEDFGFAFSLVEMTRWERAVARTKYLGHRIARRFRA